MLAADIKFIANDVVNTPTNGQHSWQGGTGVFAVAATFAGGTIKLQWQLPDGVTWVDAGVNTTFTAAGGGIFTLHKCPIRCFITGGPPTGVYAYAYRVPV